MYGSMWAAVEIVAGSFLHNLRVPFAGGLLSAVGVMLMTAGHRSCPERGLIWRAALVCALMKSVSPSAVILGPMVGIVMEGLLLETMVRLFGGRAVGYLAGGALAVSWALAQRLLTALVAFGPNVVRLYVDAYAYASRTLGVSSFGPFDLVAAVAGIEMILGGLAAAVGLHAASRSDALAPPAGARSQPSDWFPGPPTLAEGHWSLLRLALVGVGLVAGMAGLARLPLWAATASVALFAAFVLRTYPRAARRVRRVSLWIELAAVMALAGLVFGGVRDGLAGLLGGAAAGLLMALRATLVLFAFTAVSVELRNPTILSWVERRGLRGLSDALGVAFGALPTFTRALAEHRRLWRRPWVLNAILLRIANGLVLTPDAGRRNAPTVVLAGETGAGKTTFATALVGQLRRRDIRVGGILAPGMLAGGRRSGFDIVSLASGERAPLAREQQDVARPHARWSRFAFDAAGLALGASALNDGVEGADVVVVDEVGPFELSGGGWSAALDALNDFPGVTILVVRESIVEEVRARWGGADTAVYHVSHANLDEITDRVRRWVLSAAQVVDVRSADAG